MGYQENYLPSEQKKLGYDVEIITSDRIPPFKEFRGEFQDEERIIGKGLFEENNVTIHRLPVLLESKESNQVILMGLKSKLRELKPNIVHVHGEINPVTLQTIICCKRLRFKVFVDSHSNSDNFKLNSPLKRLYYKSAKVFYIIFGKRVQCWLPITSASKDLLTEYFGISEKHMELLPLGVNTNRFFKCKESREANRIKLGYSEDEFVLVSSGKFDTSKKIDILIKAFSIVVKEVPKLRLLLIGKGSSEYMNYLNSIIESDSLNEYIRILNFVDNSELGIYYNLADVGVWPGTSSISVIEALGTELPLILPKGNDDYKVVFDASAAIDFEKNNIYSLVTALKSLIRSPEMRLELSNNARILVKEELSWEKVAEKSIGIYCGSRPKVKGLVGCPPGSSQRGDGSGIPGRFGQ
ncbi:glycosyltransferase family 4 protein [Methanosarcina soligelidi]|uniref:glycosyltransferase family 4 protein n=1 Tax=Methanosarcina soligelidi TaxID=1036677 RepID=UPI001363DBC1|nr:glycosyltransferase family 4 protein [Methanosarcina soligelidi]